LSNSARRRSRRHERARPGREARPVERGRQGADARALRPAGP